MMTLLIQLYIEHNCTELLDVELTMFPLVTKKYEKINK